jgi:transitional endoplasmic reticulum ATPase
MPTSAVQEALDRGFQRAHTSDWQGAADAFRRAVSLDPASAEVRFRLGWALWNLSEENKPSVFDLAVGYGANLVGVTGVANDRQRRFLNHKKLLQECAHWLREAIARDPQHARAHYFLAQVQKGLGLYEQAKATAKKAAELDPSNRRFAELAVTYSGTGAGGEAHPEVETSPRMTWDDLVVSDRTKKELRQIQLMMERPQLAEELGVQPPSGVLLKGEPGVGKTTIARVLASEAKCRFLTASPADVNGMFVGESERRVRDLFEKARANAPAILFIDEVDALLPVRSGGMSVHYDKVVNQFLQEMDGLKPLNRVLVVGATNRPDMLDPAVRRGGRLSREIEIPLPDREQRVKLLELFVKSAKVADSVDLSAIAEATENFSGADLKALVNEAGLQALIRIADDDTAQRVLEPEDFERAMETYTPSAERSGDN